MIKFFFLLTLLYYASCKTIYCESYLESPSDKEDCFDREIQTTGVPFCCFVHLKIENVLNYNVCCPGTKDSKAEDLLTLINEYVKDIEIAKGKTFSIQDFSCHSSYIKVGLLLLSLLLI